MQSIVTFYVDHDETTDPLTKMIDDAFFVPGQSIWNYELAVDVSDKQANKALKATRNLHKSH